MNEARRHLPLKLRLVAGYGKRGERFVQLGYGKRSLSQIARRTVGAERQQYRYVSAPAMRNHLSQVIYGHRNTPHLVALLEREWCMSIDEIREIVREDRERRAEGRPVSMGEAKAWFRQWQIKEIQSRGYSAEQAEAHVANTEALVGAIKGAA